MKLTPAEAKVLYAVAIKRHNIYLAQNLERGDEVAEWRYQQVCNDLEALIVLERKDPENLTLIRAQTKLLDKFKAAQTQRSAGE